jgi:hypothetical protein
VSEGGDQITVRPCDTCGAGFDASAATCPFCRAPRGIGGGLARMADLEDRLARVETENYLARASADDGLEDLLMRDMGGPLAPSELRDALARVDQTSDPSVADFESSLAREASIALDGIAIGDLVDLKSDDMKIVRRGLTLLKNRRWTEAVEWFSLHREALAPEKDRFALLLMLLEAFTWRLAGDHRRAGEVNQRINAHPLYRRLRGLEKN